MIFDTHAHYDSNGFNVDREEVLSSLPAAGVGLVLNPGCDVASSRMAVELAEKYPHVYAAVGIHPGDCDGCTDTDLDAIRALAAHKKVVAIGEIGLDYYWKDNAPREFQMEIFRRQLALAEELGMTEQEVEKVRIAGLFHDIGKIGVKDSVLLKQGPLTNDEYEDIKKHPSEGVGILAHFAPFAELLPIIVQHHERVDGKGYPRGLTGEEICQSARIISVADSFDAMISNRAYRKGLGFDKTMSEVERCSGSQFDPQVVVALKSLIDRLGVENFIKIYCPNA